MNTTLLSGMVWMGLLSIITNSALVKGLETCILLFILFVYIYVYWCPTRFPCQKFLSFNNNMMDAISESRRMRAYPPREYPR